MGTLHAQRSGSLLTLTLDNPGKANALDFDILRELERQIEAVELDAGVRVVLLRGTPGGTFSSGADVGQWAPLNPHQFARDWIDYGNRIFDRFERLRCPTVAAVEGVCFGGGLELALCADLRVAASGAVFRFPEVGIGAIPGWQGGPRLARLAGRGRALEAVLTMCALDAQRASEWGLVNAVWVPDAFEQELAGLLRRLAGVSPHAAALAKEAVLWSAEPGEFHAAAGAEIKGSADAAIGLHAFLNKCKPVF
jgi:enoyl-CoA hydratase/carnithine racemase